MKTRVGIIFGGNSVEHEISILSAIQANYAIDKTKYDIYNIYMTKSGEFWVGDNFNILDTFKKFKIRHFDIVFYLKSSKLYLKGIKFLPRKYKKPIDVILPIVHGKNVEDGSLAGYFNILNVPYAASDILESAIIQNKVATKMYLENKGINLIEYINLSYNEYIENTKEALNRCIKLDFPLIIKPVSLGSSIGIKIANNEEELIDAIIYGFKYENELLVEKKLKEFKEFNQALLESDGKYLPSLIEEVININPFLTFTDKYLPSETKKEIPAKIDANLKNEITNTSKLITKYLKTKGVIRIDYLYDINESKLYLNEINCIPGSLAYYLFEPDLSFSSIIDKLINNAIKTHYKKTLKLTSFKSNVLSTNRILKK